MQLKHKARKTRKGNDMSTQTIQKIQTNQNRNDNTTTKPRSDRSVKIPEDALTVVSSLVEKAGKALTQMMALDQAQVDHIVQAMAMSGVDQHMRLAKLAVQDTGRGVYEDKIIKNLFATESIYNSIKHLKTACIITENTYDDVIEIAEPVGVIAGVTPVTNPTSTTMFKAIIAMKTRNPIIFSFHPSAQTCSSEAARVMYDAAVQAGAPHDCIQWIDTPSIEATSLLMNHPGVALILATGGSGMVKAAYSSGKPALGVGPGNVPCYIEKTARVERAVTDLILSKTFDHGMICASEQAVIVDRVISSLFERLMVENQCYFLNEGEITKLSAYAVDEAKGQINPDIVGKSAFAIASAAGLTVPEDTKILIAPLQGVGAAYPLSREKLSPILAYYVAEDSQAGLALSEQMLAFGGMGHSAVIHSEDQDTIRNFGEKLKVGRLIVNAPSTHGAIGDIYNANMPSLTLGCGSYGSNATTANVSAVHLINVKRLAQRQNKMQWFKIPEKIYFESGSIRYLQDMPDISRAFIVTDASMVRLGYVNKVLHYLRRRSAYVHSEIFAEVEPDPSVETILRGRQCMEAFKPDVIIALGGGSVIDAAKGMWLFYEHPELDFGQMRLKFLDIRKRVYAYPNLGSKAKLVAIPTTSGTGSEVTSFAVISDRKNHAKYPLADYSMTPDVAIIDPDFVASVPPSVTADTGMDVLTHAIEAYVSIMASDFTDGLAVKAIQLVFEYLPRAFRNGADALAREKMHNASCIAGMAFTNAFLGINHSMAHKLGGAFGIPHGRANAVLLPHVIAYNAARPSKFVSFPKYETYLADKKYAEIAKALGLPAATVQEGVTSLIAAINDLMCQLGMPLSIEACGISRENFETKVTDLAEQAFEDQCTTANPRMPLIRELELLYRKAYAKS